MRASGSRRGEKQGRGREKRDPENTRRVLLAAGAALFSELGYDAVPIEQIAARAGVNKALISYHFGGKRGLYAAILASGFEQIARRFEAAEAGARDAAAALHALLQVFGAFYREHPDFPSLFMREVLSTGIDPGVVPHFVAIIGVVRRLAARGVREGVFRPVHPMLLHLGLIGALVFFMSTERARRRAASQHTLPLAMPELAEFLGYLEGLTLRGLAPDPSESHRRPLRSRGAASRTRSPSPKERAR